MAVCASVLCFCSGFQRTANRNNPLQQKTDNNTQQHQNNTQHPLQQKHTTPKQHTTNNDQGLGTSSAAEAKEYFAALDAHRKRFVWEGDDDADAIEMAFSKKRVEDRKRWLSGFIPGTYLDQSVDAISYADFVHKELILFSRADLERSIPSIVDGLKPGQRKILFCAFKRNLKKDIKVCVGGCVGVVCVGGLRGVIVVGGAACFCCGLADCQCRCRCWLEEQTIITNQPQTTPTNPTQPIEQPNPTSTPNKPNTDTKQTKQVAQLAGYVSEHSAYHHGEASLQQTIIGLAQDFVGSNNVNLLFPSGQFGTRLQGGKDAASARCGLDWVGLGWEGPGNRREEGVSRHRVVLFHPSCAPLPAHL